MDIQHNDTQHSKTQHNDAQHNDNLPSFRMFLVVSLVILYAECHYVIMPNVVMLNAGMLSVMGHQALLSFIVYLFLSFSISLAQLPSSK